MSYIRWSTKLPITERCKTCGREPWDESKGPIRERFDEWFEYDKATGYVPDPDGINGKRLCPECISPWYIYADYRDCLAVWGVGTSELPCYSDDEVRDILASGDFECIPGWDGDPYGVVREAMADYLEEKP